MVRLGANECPILDRFMRLVTCGIGDALKFVATDLLSFHRRPPAPFILETVLDVQLLIVGVGNPTYSQAFTRIQCRALCGIGRAVNRAASELTSLHIKPLVPHVLEAVLDVQPIFPASPILHKLALAGAATGKR